MRAIGLAIALLCGCSGRGPLPCDDVEVGRARPCQPPATKLSRPAEAIPNEYIVVFADDVTDVCGESYALAAKYGGEVVTVWASGLHACHMKLADPRAPYLAAESSVCYVEQNAIGYGYAH